MHLSINPGKNHKYPNANDRNTNLDSAFTQMLNNKCY